MAKKKKSVNVINKADSIQQVGYVSRDSEIQKRIEERSKYIQGLLEDKTEDNEE